MVYYFSIIPNLILELGTSSEPFSITIHELLIFMRFKNGCVNAQLQNVHGFGLQLMFFLWILHVSNHTLFEITLQFPSYILQQVRVSAYYLSSLISFLPPSLYI